MKKFVSLLLALVMVFSLAACGGDNPGTSNPPADNNTGSPATDNPGGSNLAADNEREVDVEAYDNESYDIYENVLGDFYDAYMTAKAEVSDLDLRLGLMAIAEAKLMESGMITPIRADGGNEGMSRVAPYTSCTVDWGYDEYRYPVKVITTDPIKSGDYQALKDLYAELAGTGTYVQAARDYLTSHGYTLKSTFEYSYDEDPLTWDWMASSRTTTGEYCAPLMMGLLSYDAEGIQRPAMATSYDVSADNLVYTFHIREGVKWVDFQGRELDDVQADDWVAALQHAVDTNGGLGDLLSGVIVNLDKYISGEITDFSEVGVKAVDKYTLEYTLVEPTSWFISMTGYSALAPMCRSYYVSQGGAFGEEYAEGYDYGTDPFHIAYNGAFLISNWTEKNIITAVKNPAYYDAANVTIETINYHYYDGSDVMATYNDFKAGTLDSVGITANNRETAQKESPEGETESYYDLYHFLGRTTSTSFVGFFNVNRYKYSNFNDSSKGVSGIDLDEAARTFTAQQNAHFRLAIAMGLDRGTYHAQSYGDALKYCNINNSYTPGTFMSLQHDITLDINGTPTKFPAGTWYGEMMQAQIDADGVKLKVWDEATQSSTQYDGWYNVDNAREQLEMAIAELADEGVEISAEKPIHFQYNYYSASPVSTNRANVIKQSLEASLEGKVVVDIVDFITAEDYRDSGYNTDVGYEANYDWYDGSGWGPDYGDVQTYLDTVLPGYDGYMAKVMGLF